MKLRQDFAVALVTRTIAQITGKLLLVACSEHSRMTLLGVFYQKYNCSEERDPKKSGRQSLRGK